MIFSKINKLCLCWPILKANLNLKLALLNLIETEKTNNYFTLHLQLKILYVTVGYMSIISLKICLLHSFSYNPIMSIVLEQKKYSEMWSV